MTPHPNKAMGIAHGVAPSLSLASFCTSSARDHHEKSRGSRLVPRESSWCPFGSTRILVEIMCHNHWVFGMFFSNHELFATTRILVVPTWLHENSRGSYLVPRNFSWKCLWFGENSRGNDLACLCMGFIIAKQKRCISQTVCTYRWI